MNFKFLITLVILLACLTGCEEKRSFSIDNAEVKATLLEDGSLYVQEILTYTFDGQFNGMTRFLDVEDPNNIQFFEAYHPQNDLELGHFNFNNLERYKVQRGQSKQQFKTFNASKNETKKIYYRYRIDNIAEKYTDISELKYAFFKDNEVDIHNIDIEITFAKKFGSNNIHAFLHDRTGGNLDLDTPSIIHYNNKKLDETGTANIRVLFPSTFIPEMKSLDKKISLEKELAKEAKWQNRMDIRPIALSYGAKIINFVNWILFFMIVIFILRPHKFIVWIRSFDIRRTDLEEIDLLEISYIYKEGNLKKRDFIAGLLSLQQRGLIIQNNVPSVNRYQEDKYAPKTTLQFTLTRNAKKLTCLDQLLIKWLFTSIKGNQVCRLDMITGPTKKERKVKALKNSYHNQFNLFNKKHENWYSLVTQSEPFSNYKWKVEFRKILIRGLILVHYCLIIYMCYFDVFPNLFFVCLTVFSSVAAIYIAIWKYNHKGFVIGYFLLFFIFSIIEFNYIPVTETFNSIFFISILFVLFMPKYIFTTKLYTIRYAIKRWKRQLKHGAIYAKNDDERLKHAALASVCLQVGKPFYINILKKHTISQEIITTYLFNLQALQSIKHTKRKLFVLEPFSSSNSDSNNYGGGDSGGGGGTGAF